MIAKVIAAFVLCLSTAAFAAPKEILLIRHAEKPSGDEGSHLSKRGQKRAAALADFFTEDSRVTDDGVVSVIFAAAPRKSTGSVRPQETVEPLAQKLSLQIDTDYEADDYRQLANELLSDSKYEGKVVLVCWAHDQLAEFGAALGVTDSLEWSSSTFDRVWKLQFANGKLTSFGDLPQRLLKGDSDQ